MILGGVKEKSMRDDGAPFAFYRESLFTYSEWHFSAASSAVELLAPSLLALFAGMKRSAIWKHNMLPTHAQFYCLSISDPSAADLFEFRFDARFLFTFHRPSLQKPIFTLHPII
jgi:hypothetical protein